MLAFFGQVNLADVSPFGLGLPAEGLLSFFFAADMDSLQPQNSGAGIVFYVNDEKLTPRKPPKRAPDRFRMCTCRLIHYPSLPPPYGNRIEELWGLDFLADEELHSAYAECIHQIDESLGINDLSTAEGYNYHQFMGYPEAVQYTPIEMCMEIARNYPVQAPTWRQTLWKGIKDFVLSRQPSAEPIVPQVTAADLNADDLSRCRAWRSLLMIQEDEHANIRLLDSGRLYFMYPQGQLARGDFANPWTMVDFG